MTAVLESGLQVFPFFLFQNQETFLWRIILVGEGVSINFMHDVNTTHTLQPEVSYQSHACCSSDLSRKEVERDCLQVQAIYSNII